MVKDSLFYNWKTYVMAIKNFINPKGHQNPINESKVTVFLLTGWILPIGGASVEEGLRLQPAQQACFNFITIQVFHGLRICITRPIFRTNPVIFSASSFASYSGFLLYSCGQLDGAGHPNIQIIGYKNYFQEIYPTI
jgi:hypothetical protein